MIRELLVIYLLYWICAQETSIESLNKQIKVEGIVKVELNEDDEGNIALTYQTPMPDPVYRTLASPAYILNFAPTQGIQVLTDCSGPQNQTQLSCAIVANSSSSYSSIFMTYVVSDQEDFLVGSFSWDFEMKSTAFVTQVKHQIVLSQTSVFREARGEIDFLPFISGVSSMDEDFGLQLSLTQSFDIVTSTLFFEVLIDQMDEKNMTVTFGYILFLPRVYILNYFPNYSFEPDNHLTNKQVLFYIGAVQPLKNSRLLQTQVIDKSTEESNTSASVEEERLQEQKIFENIILQGNFSLKDFNTRTVNPTISHDVIRSPNLLGSSSEVSEEEEFSNIFSTNGLNIMLDSSFSDPIIYLQLNSPVDFQPQRFVQPLGIASDFITPFAFRHSFTLNITLNTQYPVPPDCKKGFLIFKMTKIDQIQSTFKYFCISCTWEQYFDWSTRSCQKFPVLPHLNLIDLV